MNMQINAAAIREQHQAHIERRKRFEAASRRHALCPKLVLYDMDSDAHVTARAAHMGLLALIADGGATGAYARPTIRKVIDATAEYYGVTLRDIASERRIKECMTPRQVAMYLARVLTGKSYPMIGAAIGGRDHTTVMSGVRKIERVLPDSPDSVSYTHLTLPTNREV